MSAKIEIHPGDPRGLDRLKIDALLVPLYEGSSQPLGAAGSVDWRLCGRLGRMIKSGVFRGSEREMVLTTALGRFGVERIFLFGLGAPAVKSKEQRAEEAGRILAAITAAGATELAIAPPELADSKAPPPADVLAAWLPAFKSALLERVVILDAGSIAGLYASEARSEAKPSGGPQAN